MSVKKIKHVEGLPTINVDIQADTVEGTIRLVYTKPVKRVVMNYEIAEWMRDTIDEALKDLRKSKMN